MRAAHVAALMFSAAAGSLAAAEIVLQTPVDCTLGDDCFIQHYVDHDPGPDGSDFQCGPLANDGHSGTDFRVATLQDMLDGVDVVAAAAGVVTGTRDGMADKVYTSADAAALNGRSCGNGVSVDHGDGWTTQYCHLKRGSITRRTGAEVRPGDVLGQIGLSGQTAFPHVHVTVRKDGAVVDPFDPDGQITCGAPSAHTLWDAPLAYVPGAVMEVGFADSVPSFDAIQSGDAARGTLPPDAPALVVFGYVLGGQPADRMRLTIEGPSGTIIDNAVSLDRTQAELFRAVGKRLTTDGWPEGTYEGTVKLVRKGQVISTRTGSVIIR
ncbi:M23 family metallopeptidase [Tateyamaria sp. SN6-1]|uniref:M23 family metallopeptidase n=1 Tax=Tateyamaria sp. SN6-1 TaxID=3092148 RepID=UPI0039F5AD07